MCLFKKESVDCKFEYPKPSASIKFTVSASLIFFEINSNLVFIFKFSPTTALKISLDKSSMFGSSKKYLFITYENLTKKLQ